MTSAVETAASTHDREIVLTRLIDAPRALVFEAWTDPRHVDHWWGPEGFTTSTQQIDVREGGSWRFVMHGPDGTDYPNLIVYQEIVRPERVIYSHGSGEVGDPHQFHVTTTFAEEDGKTRLTMRMLFQTAAARDETAAFGAIELGNQTLGRFERYMYSRRNG